MTPVVDAVPPPPGYVVDFNNPQQQLAAAHFIVFLLLGLLSTLCVVARLCGNLGSKRGLSTGSAGGIGDALFILSYIASIAMQSVQTWSISKGGLCHHAWEMSIETVEKYMLSSYIAAPLFVACQGLSKLSLLMLLRPLAASVLPWYRITMWAAIVIVACHTVTITAMLLACSPVRAYTNTGESLRGFEPPTLYLINAAISIASDAFTFIVPVILVVGQLQLKPSERHILLAKFGFASLTAVPSIIRIVYLKPLLGTSDIPWDAAPASVCSFVEANLLIICLFVVTIRQDPTVSNGATTPQSKDVSLRDLEAGEGCEETKSYHAALNYIEQRDKRDDERPKEDDERAILEGDAISQSGFSA